jgi:NADH:ubiquinone oxidoreductase subunit K
VCHTAGLHVAGKKIFSVPVANRIQIVQTMSVSLLRNSMGFSLITFRQMWNQILVRQA